MPELLLLLSLLGGAPSSRLDIGRPASAREVEAANLSVLPDGSGLPKGHGTAQEGRALFAAQCATCHGAKGEGNDFYPQLIGGRGTLGTASPVLTVGSYWPYATTVWDYIRRAMPYIAPGTLTTNQVYALTAFLLTENGIIDAKTVLTERNLAKVRMPNRNGFVSDPRPDVHASAAVTSAPGK